MNILLNKGFINALITYSLFLSLFACTSNVRQEKTINKNGTLLEHKMVFSLFSEPEQVSSFFDIRKLPGGLYSLHVGVDSLPISLNEDSIGVIEINNDLFVFAYNPTVYRNTGIILFSSRGKKNIKYFNFGSIKECSVFKCRENYVLKILEYEEENFSSPPYMREHWIILNNLLGLSYKDISILKKASVLQDTSNLHIETSLNCYNNTILINIKGFVDNINLIDTIQIYPKMYLSGKLISLKWNNMNIFNLAE